MAQLPDIIPVRDLRQETAAVLKRVQSSGQPVVITQRGRTAAVMLSLEAYERGERERQVLRLLVRGEQEISAGIGHDLDDVLAEADAILGARRIASRLQFRPAGPQAAVSGRLRTMARRETPRSVGGPLHRDQSAVLAAAGRGCRHQFHGAGGAVRPHHEQGLRAFVAREAEVRARRVA